MESKGVNVFVILLVGVFGGLCLLFGLTLAVQTGVSPLSQDLKTVLAGQAKIEKELKSSSSAILLSRIDALEKELAQLKSQRGQPTQPAIDLTKVHDIPVGDSFTMGPENAAVTFVEFTDLHCPYCSKFHPALMEAVKAYPDQVRYVMKHFPLSMHKNARAAAKAVIAAGLQGKYLEMLELVFSDRDANEEKFAEFAQKLGLNVDQYKKDLQEKGAELDQKIDQDIQLGGRVGVRGTPTYFINGRLSMARDVEGWKKEIEIELKAKNAAAKK